MPVFDFDVHSWLAGSDWHMFRGGTERASQNPYPLLDSSNLSVMASKETQRLRSLWSDLYATLQPGVTGTHLVQGGCTVRCPMFFDTDAWS